MDIREVMEVYGIEDRKRFVDFVTKNYKSGKTWYYRSGVMMINDDDIESILSSFNPNYKETNEQKRKEDEQKRKALSEMLITSGFSFDGYKVVKYSGYISGDDVIQVERTTKWFQISDSTEVGDQLSRALVKLRRNALAELKEAAYALGCNAVIGVDFDYLTLEPETAGFGGHTVYLPYVFCVTANGNAVIIEKEEC